MVGTPTASRWGSARKPSNARIRSSPRSPMFMRACPGCRWGRDTAARAAAATADAARCPGDLARPPQRQLAHKLGHQLACSIQRPCPSGAGQQADQRRRFGVRRRVSQSAMPTAKTMPIRPSENARSLPFCASSLRPRAGRPPPRPQWPAAPGTAETGRASFTLHPPARLRTRRYSLPRDHKWQPHVQHISASPA